MPDDVAYGLGNHPVLSRAAVEAISDAESIAFDDLGHSPQIEAPERFHEMLLETFRGRTNGPAPERMDAGARVLPGGRAPTRRVSSVAFGHIPPSLSNKVGENRRGVLGIPAGCLGQADRVRELRWLHCSPVSCASSSVPVITGAALRIIYPGLRAMPVIGIVPPPPRWSLRRTRRNLPLRWIRSCGPPRSRNILSRRRTQDVAGWLLHARIGGALPARTSLAVAGLVVALELRVDPETGRVKVDRVAAAVESGAAVSGRAPHDRPAADAREGGCGSRRPAQRLGT